MPRGKSKNMTRRKSKNMSTRKSKNMSTRKSIKNMSQEPIIPLTAYCMKCKTQVTIIDPKEFLNEKDKPMTGGFCSKCKGKVCTTKLLPK
jgi:hypothetical protein